MNCLLRELKNIYSGSDFKNEDILSLLSVILGHGKSTVKSTETAKKLLAVYNNNLKSLSNASIKELSDIVGKNNTKTLLASMEFFRQVSLYQDKDVIISSPEDVAALLMNEMRYYQKEVFKVILLNTKNAIIKVDTVSVGILDASLVHPREVFSLAIKENASSIILIHNHPSGDITPSQQDIEITKTLFEASKILNIELRDHIILAGNKFLSLKEKKFI